MPVSAEIRWFWPSRPAQVADWFFSTTVHGCAAGGGTTRIDQYLRDPEQDALGLKHRAGQPGVEIKGCIAILPQPLAAGPLAGTIELWGKWFAAPLALHAFATVTVEKRRWLRTFAVTGSGCRELPPDYPPPGRGCRIELTEVTLADGAQWWTLGGEAFGTLASVTDDLRTVAAQLATRRPPPCGAAWAGGYPAWLAQLDKS